MNHRGRSSSTPQSSATTRTGVGSFRGGHCAPHPDLPRNHHCALMRYQFRRILPTLGHDGAAVAVIQGTLDPHTWRWKKQVGISASASRRVTPAHSNLDMSTGSPFNQPATIAATSLLGMSVPVQAMRSSTNSRVQQIAHISRSPRARTHRLPHRSILGYAAHQ